MKEIIQEIKITEYESEKELSENDAVLLKKAYEALDYSYSPYSNFQVGAAAVLTNGEVVLGSNQENASFPAGICAERAAVYSACNQFKNQKIIAVAITVKSKDFEVPYPIAPCGICRQVLLETEIKQDSSIKIILKGSKGKIYTIPSAQVLLPIYFFENGLKKA